MKKHIFLLVLLLSHMPISTVSVVYNFRIAQVTRKPIALESNKRPNSFAPLIFDFFQKTRCLDIAENYAGGLLTYTRNFAKYYYLRTDFAVAHVDQKIEHVNNVNVTETDDILFTFGRNFTVGQHSKMTLSGMFGIPTHRVHTLQRVGFGTGLVGIGGQLDGLSPLGQHIDFLWGTRYNYFIPAKTCDAFGNSYKFTVGSIADVLVAFQTSRQLSHGVEVGYDGRWGFGIKACPVIPDLSLLNYMRNNVYVVYKYTFLTERVAHRLLFTISYGRDAKPKLHGYNAVMVWGSWGIAF
ncbi:MAG TPA: hypothetical protein VLG50_00810 [Candidatus Saccharimonadales bacterium]|nr:hypothetical protein [Candidatus Saccharimonadales bacterium]